MIIRNAAYNSLISCIIPVLAQGLQALWVIDPVNGNDAGDGSPAAPLATMGELNNRLCNNVIRQPTVVQTVGDVLDCPPQLLGLRLQDTGSLSFVGTPTTLATGGISLVTTLNTTTTFQLTTTGGYTWTAADVGRRLAFSTAAGDLAFVQEVLSGTQIVVGPLLSATGGFATPTTALTWTLQGLPAIQPPAVQGVQVQIPLTTSTLVSFQNYAIGAGYLFVDGIFTQFFGCALRPTSFQSVYNCNANTVFRASCWLPNTQIIVQGGGNCSFQGVTVIGGSILMRARQWSMQACSLNNAPVVMSQGCTCTMSSGMHFRNTASPLQLTQNARMSVTAVVSGSVGNTGRGLTISGTSAFAYSAAGTKPTVTGASGDMLIGATPIAYAAGASYIDTAANAGTLGAFMLGT